ncbi:MAG: TIGR00282 family metallophosphoesterase [Candidatus Aminicenantes bacterium]|nr:TIGR00282 family metallophosphoesterase [Candidatus Aminicenantes bacterium]
MPGSVRILFLGDVIGRPGRQAMRRFLPELTARHAPTFVVVNAENAAGGSGLTEDIGRDLLAEADVLTSGNHIWDKKEALAYMDREPRLLRPANYPPGNPGRGYGVFVDRGGRKVGVLNLQGRVFMEPLDCPFRAADEALEKIRLETPIVVVDFHAEATSEKQAMGWHLDGRVSAVIGTHTHVPTADERILPRGTAYLTDAGMAGGNSTVIGIRKEQALARFLTAVPQRFEPGRNGLVLSALFLEVDAETGRALDVRREHLVEESHGD